MHAIFGPRSRCSYDEPVLGFTALLVKVLVFSALEPSDRTSKTPGRVQIGTSTGITAVALLLLHLSRLARGGKNPVDWSPVKQVG